MPAEILKQNIHVVFDALITNAEKYCERRDAKALNLIKEIRHIASETGSIRQLALADYICAYYDCFALNKYDESIKLLNKALLTLNKEDHSQIGYKLLMTLGNAYQLKGDLFSAQESYLSGLKALETKPKLTTIEHDFLGTFYLNLSILFSSSALKIGALEYLNKAIIIYKEIDNKYKLSKCFTAYAQVLDTKGDFEGAFAKMEKALQMDEELGNEYHIALSKANLGILAIKIGQFENSYKYIAQAFEFYEKKKLRYEKAVIKMELGQALKAMNRLDESITYLTGAETTLILLGNKKELSDIYRMKADVFTLQGNHKAANMYLEKYVAGLKNFFDTEKINALTRAKNEFETDQKEKEAKLLRDKNEEIQLYIHKLEVSNNQLQQFAHAVSHDLREPLRMINSYTSMLNRTLGETATEQQTQFVNYVLDGTKRMEQLVHDLLALAKVGADPVIARVNLNDVLKDVQMNLAALINEKNAEIEIGDLPTISTDYTLMIQLFQNLMANGLIYNKSILPRVFISAKNDGCQIEICVEDNGVGIPEKSKGQIFQIFNRLQKNDGTYGTGIGLSICKKIIDQMKGTIEVLDGHNGGTVMRMVLPV